MKRKTIETFVKKDIELYEMEDFEKAKTNALSQIDNLIDYLSKAKDEINNMNIVDICGPIDRVAWVNSKHESKLRSIENNLEEEDEYDRYGYIVYVQESLSRINDIAWNIRNQELYKDEIEKRYFLFTND